MFLYIKIDDPSDAYQMAILKAQIWAYWDPKLEAERRIAGLFQFDKLSTR